MASIVPERSISRPSRRRLGERLAERLGRRLGAWTRRCEAWRDGLAAGSRRRRVAGGLSFLARGTWHVVRNHRYLTALKLANMALVELQMALRTERVLGRPYRLKIEPTNICNTRCQLCPTGEGRRGRARGTMSLADFQRLVDRHRRSLYVLDLSMWGDPLLAQDIHAMVRYAHERGIWTYLSSNLHAFDPARGDAEALLDSGLDMITVSLHGTSQESFAAYQPGKDYAATLDKLRALLEAKRRRGSDKPAVQVNFVVTRRNQHEVDGFLALTAELGVAPLLSAPSLNLRFLDRDRWQRPLGLSAGELASRRAARLGEWLPDDARFVVEPYRRMLAGTWNPLEFNGAKPMPCDWPWRSSVINWDGTVAACCGSFETADDLGNALTQPFGAIWNGTAYRMARRSFRRAAPVPEGYANPCRECPGFLV